ncbi:MAG TPA: 6,7-dimethyl-8-ribityllumazine synthase [Ignavibacteria bacterium]|nr:6,7-dimethyl-8-ribityllumazine synthase [Ignavibacteria bacterium]
MLKKIHGELTSENYKIAIIISRFNEPIVENLLKGAVKALINNGVEEKNIKVFYVPGAFEIPSVLKKICRKNESYKRKFDGILTIGCVIKGETAHFEYICSSVSQSINKISYEYEMPAGFCVLTCYTPQQAYERSGMPPDSNNNKGFEAAVSMLEMISLMKKI